jgi:hypothetical protein
MERHLLKAINLEILKDLQKDWQTPKVKAKDLLRAILMDLLMHWVINLVRPMD